MAVSSVPIESIKPDPNQPRKVFSDSHIQGLASSLLIEGLINPIEVDQQLMIITGECRWRAANLLGWTEISVNINNKPLDDYTRLRHQMAENIHQSGGSDESMNPIDIAKGLHRLAVWIYEKETGKDYRPGRESQHEKFYGLKIIKQVSDEVGMNEDTVWDYLDLLDHPEFVQKDIVEGRPRTYYRETSRTNLPPEIKQDLNKKIAEGDYSSRKELEEDIVLLKKLPDLGKLSINRTKAKEALATNKILNEIAKLGLALEALSLNNVEEFERPMIISQLNWIKRKIEEYLVDK